MTSLAEPMLVPVNTFPSSSIKKAFICFPVLSSFFPKKKTFPFFLLLYMNYIWAVKPDIAIRSKTYLYCKQGNDIETFPCLNCIEFIICSCNFQPFSWNPKEKFFSNAFPSYIILFFFLFRFVFRPAVSVFDRFVPAFPFCLAVLLTHLR